MGDTAAAKSTQAHESELTFQRSEFFAEDELIEINPMVRFGVISFIRGNFGPFEPSITTTVRLRHHNMLQLPFIDNYLLTRL